ncbi:MAG: nitrilase/cyanide hydratase and apolipoprotein N-acyltransferase [Mycobacterium sp.]|nr:nitrilase/cyanide hydratase and apolipoprotein N-acyltransferase [Mycobacterium sp.]
MAPPTGSAVRLAAVAGHFGRDLAFDLDRIATIVRHARRAGAGLVVFPDGTLGGYLGDLREPDEASLPPALGRDDPVFAHLAELAGPAALCVGYCELAGGVRYNAAVCLSGDGVLGRHRKVHQPPGEALVYGAGDRFLAFDTPVGRVGMMIDHDKTFPESARSLALDGATVLACLSAWPSSVTRPARQLHRDRQARLFDLYDQARAAENQVVLVSSNMTGMTGGLRFLGQGKVVGPGGEVLARTPGQAGLAVADLDVQAEIDCARRVLHHLKERKPSCYPGLA